MFKTLSLKYIDHGAFLTLARPEIRNAFDDQVIDEIRMALKEISSNSTLRYLVVTGEGTAFSAGADIAWMKRMGEADYQSNLYDANALAELFDSLSSLTIPTVARVNGPAMGGGVGLVAACDITVGVETAFFSFSEVKIGLVPAVIGPYVISRVGVARSRELFITGRRINASEAFQMGLLNFVVTPDNLDSKVEEILELIRNASPNAVRSAKELSIKVPTMTKAESKVYTAELIAGLRTSPEGREGTLAFLEKRKPNWAQ